MLQNNLDDIFLAFKLEIELKVDSYVGTISNFHCVIYFFPWFYFRG